MALQQTSRSWHSIIILTKLTQFLEIEASSNPYMGKPRRLSLLVKTGIVDDFNGIENENSHVSK